MELFISLVTSLLMGSLTGYIAQKKGRDGTIWFVAGMLLGIFAVIALYVLPNLNKRGDEEEHKTREEGIEEQSAIIDITTDEKGSAADLANKMWFYLGSKKEQYGPMAIKELKSSWTEHRVNAETYVWCEGLDNWKKIKDLPELVACLNSAK